MDSYNRKKHTKYSLKVHLIFVTKYRKHIFVNDKADTIKQSIYDICKKINCSIIQMETDKNHIHILLSYNPDISISEIVKRLKQYSTYTLWKYHSSFLSKEYWKKKELWSDGYFVCSTGEASTKTIEKYIQNQG